MPGGERAVNPFDILILVFILMGAIQGYRKGLISGIISLGGNILGLILAAKNYQGVKLWLETKTDIAIWIEKIIYSRVFSLVEKKAEEAQDETMESIFSILPKEFEAFSERFQLPDMELYSLEALENIAITLSQSLTGSLMNIISFSLILIGVIIIAEIISSIILSPLGFFTKTFNSGGGLLVGGLVSFLGLAIIFGLLSPVISFITSNGGLKFLSTSVIYPHLLNWFSLLQEILRLNFQGNFANPIDLQDINVPIEWKKIIPDVHNIDI